MTTFSKTYDLNKLQADKPETVDHPSHYGGDTPHEHVKCMEATGLDKDAFLYNCTKYIWRAGKKDNLLEDLRKARWYLERRIQQLERDIK